MNQQKALRLRQHKEEKENMKKASEAMKKQLEDLNKKSKQTAMASIKVKKGRESNELLPSRKSRHRADETFTHQYGEAREQPRHLQMAKNKPQVHVIRMFFLLIYLQ